ncbi:hypothetical protein Taro_043630, partial [Colocasia esculenta]|nr:hypothetical protein [Colocasia esculenta]
MPALPQIYIHPSEMPTYRMYNGTGNSYLHIKEFFYESSHWQQDPIVLAYLFRKSLEGPALEWFYSLEPSEAGDFRSLHKKFLQRYKDRVSPYLSIMDLASEKMGANEAFVQFADRWRSMATRLQHELSESEQIKIIISNSTLRFRHILAMNQITSMEELYERGGRNFFLDDSNVTSRVSRILVDPMFSGCDGYRKANVTCVRCARAFLGLTGPIVSAYSTPGFFVCDRDSTGCRVLNATLLSVVFLLPLCSANRLHVRHVLGAGRPADISLGKATP